jgi:phenylacetate-CoA ligase
LESQWLSSDEIAARQLVSVRRVVDYAAAHVPFYKEAYKGVGYRVGDLRDLSQLSELPIVEKDDVRRDPKAFVPEEFERRRLFEGFTSGTSGTPLRTFKTRASYQRNWAFQERVRSWFGIKKRDVRATLNARPVAPPLQRRPPFWRHDRFTHNWVFSVFHFSEATLPHYVEALGRIGPREIHGYPSAVSEVARAAILQGETRIRPRAVITSSETLLDTQRETIERAFGCSVRDQYGSAENVVWVSQCELGTYHVHPEYGYLETVRGQRPVRGEDGEVVGTGFINPAMILIRYRLGDSMAVDPDANCDCGRSFSIVRQLIGRTDDVLFSVDGRPLGRLDPLFKGLDTVVEGQIVQDECDHLTINLVTAGDHRADVQTLHRRLTDAFGPGIRLSFEFPDSIPRTASGKFAFQRNLSKR